MTVAALLFWLIAAVSVSGALGVVFAPRVAHAVMSLLVVMLALAVSFYLLGAPVIAAMQLIIYAGAVIVLFLFVVMLLDLGVEVRSLIGRGGLMPIAAVAGVVIFTAAAVTLILAGPLPAPAGPPGGDAQTIGRALFGKHVALFLLIGILLTAAADGIVALTREDATHEDATHEDAE